MTTNDAALPTALSVNPVDDTIMSVDVADDSDQLSADESNDISIGKNNDVAKKKQCQNRCGQGNPKRRSNSCTLTR